jgi:hypothetical protein
MGRAQTKIFNFGVVGPTTRLEDLSRTRLESQAIEGDSPVREKEIKQGWHLSRAGHVKPGLNLGRPLSKAKYSSMTDSEPVPRGKGEKNPF